MLVSCLIAFAALGFTIFASHNDTADAAPPAHTEWQLHVEDNFDGSSINLNNWYPKYFPSWHPSTHNFSNPSYEVSDGTLKLRIPYKGWGKDVTGNNYVVSGIVSANQDWLPWGTGRGFTTRNMTPDHSEKAGSYAPLYGYYEIRARANIGGGDHIAWWITGMQDDFNVSTKKTNQNGEVDIFEILGRNGGEYQINTHKWDDPGMQSMFSNVTPTGFNVGDWHVYGFEWLPGSMKMYLDGVVIKQFNFSPSYRSVMLLSMYESEDNSYWTGPYDPSTTYPKYFEIDYYKHYKLPADYINIALNKTTSAISQNSHTSAMAADENTGTWWSAGNGNANNWWKVDLGQDYDLTGSEIVFLNDTYAWKYKVEISQDNTNWTTVWDSTANTSTAQTQTHSYKAAARYLRVMVTQTPTSLWTAFSEFRVFGSPVNIAKNKFTTAISQNANTSDRVVDGNAGTWWSAGNGNPNNWWKVDLGSNYNLTGSQIQFLDNDRLWKYKIEVSADDVNWTTVADKTENTSQAQVQTHNYSATGRYLKVTVTETPLGAWTAFSEFRVFGN
ncbi:discoidin domain-containing protein [Paenibacillus sp. NPDC058071]|uniref:discoidin domain-containing protein n=1 Tax=Paenibacillus sp. NPDC058071 TaxID=3346326 RepID=UPI0036DB6322